ncbi:MAG: glycosyltransferase family 1 protein [Candidatus Daviesbacteria bacterium]|nr:glycosyltransferase family 1 protein [Candidatus Daviesbacteria bacterium]
MDTKIRVGFDISQIAHKGGVATYTKNLADCLLKLSGLEMVYFYSSLRKTYKGKLKNVKSYRLPPTLFEMLFNRWRNVGIEKFIGPLDIFHSSDWTQPKSKAKKVTTYHDVVPFKYPQWSYPKIVAVHKRRLKLVEKEIDAVIVVSESTKKDLLEVSRIPENKITVIYEGPSFTLQGDALEPDKIKKFKEKYNLPDKFILAIGGIGERRNLERAKEATRGLNLVIAGVTLPWLSMEELGLLYHSARVLLYPSLYEGFGIPILDAFSTGTPVITSNVSSMPEVGGNAAIYVNPQSVEDIKEKLNTVLSDEKLRQDLIKKGFERVKGFSWEKAAKETAAVYRRLLE